MSGKGGGKGKKGSRSGSARSTRRRSGSRSDGRGQRGTTPTRPERSSRHPLGGDQVEGRQAVRELLLAGRRRAGEVVISAEVDPAPILDDIIDLADEQKVTIREVSRARFESLTRTESAQGVFATAAPLEPVDIDDLLVPEGGVAPFLLLLDGVTDPGNLGAVLRTAEGAGVTGVVLPRHRAAHVTPTVAKTAAGAVEHLRIAVVSGLPAAMKKLAGQGVWTVGLDAGGATSLYELAIADEPLGLVLGAEGAGLSRLVRQRCDVVASIPLDGVLGSLNVAAAAAVSCFEIARRRAGAGAGSH